MTAQAVIATLPLAGALLAFLGFRRAERAAVAFASFSAVAALALLIGEIAGVNQSPGSVAFAVVMLAAITAVSSIVQIFALRYLEDESNRSRFFALAGLLTFATAWIAIAPTFVTFTAAWVVAGLGLLGIVGYDRRLQSANKAVGMTAFSELVSSFALVAATVITASLSSTSSLDEVGLAAAELSQASVLGIDAAALTAVLLVIAAITRCAQLPLGGWLQASLFAPTPVSALMHAGVVNGGGLLLIRWSPLATDSAVAMSLLVTIAVATLIVITPAIMARPDVKGSLALSTRAQMAFMLLQCALGAFAAALFHMLGHGMFKASKFLGSGGTVNTRIKAHEDIRPGAQALLNPALQAVAASLGALAAVAGAVTLIAPSTVDDVGALVLLAFVWSTSAQFIWWWLHVRRPGAVGATGALMFTFAMNCIYVGGYTAFKSLVEADLPVAGGAVVSTWVVVPVFAAAIAVTFARWLAEADWAVRLAPPAFASSIYRSIYTTALTIGNPTRSALTRAQTRTQGAGK